MKKTKKTTSKFHKSNGSSRTSNSTSNNNNSMSTLSMNKDILQEEDIFAQRQLQHANGHNTNNYVGGDSDLLGMSKSLNSKSQHSMNQSQNGGNGGGGSGDNDLLGLSASSSMTSLSATNQDNDSNSNNPATNELLELSYHYEAPKPLPTADLLGFSADNNDCNNDPSNKHNQLPQSSTSTTANNELLSLEYNINEIENPFQTETAMKINDAYVALEQMRVANLEVEFGHNIDTQKCVQCIRQTPSNQIRKKYGASSSIFSGKSFRFKNDKPCMMCGSPTCKKHSDPNFLKSKIVICTECSPLFSLDFIIECVCLNIAAEGDDDDDDNGSNEQEEQKNDQGVSDEDNDGKYEQLNTTASNDTTGSTQSATTAAPQPKRIFQPKNSIALSPKEQLRRRNIKHMVDVYDRVHLMLTYSAQFIDEIAEKLETNTRREDQVGLSSNSIGIASGLAGIAAAAAVVTPAGPPLIVASLLFGATAQASSSGSKLVNYYSAPNKVALKIISYYNLLKSILVVTNVLKEALMEDNIDVEQYVTRQVKAHDEAMIQLNISREEEEEDGKEGGGNDTKDTNTTTQKDETKVGPKQTNDDIEFEDDWETDDDSTVVSMRSKSSMATMSTTLGGIKENKQYSEDDDGFGDFQKADSIDTNSLASPKNELSLSPDKFSFSPTSKAHDDLSNNPNEPTPTVPTTKKSPDRGNTNTAVPYPDNKGKNSKTKKPTEDLLERKDTAGKLARFYSRTSLAGTSLVGAATVTVFAGAALSLAHVAFEANNFASTIKRLQAGSPSKRAKVLRAIKKDILEMNIPNTAVIAEEWDKYLVVLDERRKNSVKQ